MTETAAMIFTTCSIDAFPVSLYSSITLSVRNKLFPRVRVQPGIMQNQYREEEQQFTRATRTKRSNNVLLNIGYRCGELRFLFENS